MLFSTDRLGGMALEARDGIIGHVTDFLIDDEEWVVRYFKVNTGNWLPGANVLISPRSAGVPDLEARILPVDLTRDQVKHAPVPESDPPVSARFERMFSEYYRHPYSGREGLAGEKRNPHLRKASELKGYAVSAKDGDGGRVRDFLLSDRDWKAVSVIVEHPSALLFRDHKVLPVSWIKEVRWEGKSILVDRSRADIKEAPVFSR